MKTLFMECNMGAAGDMLMGALFELLPESGQRTFLDTMNGIFPDKVMLSPVPSEKCGIWGTKMNVVILGPTEEVLGSGQETHPHEHGAGCEPHTHEHGAGCEPHTHEHGAGCEPHTHEHGSGRHHHHPLHVSYPEMLAQIDSLPVSDTVKEDAKALYA